MAEQTEKAFLKETRVFLSSKKSMKGKRPGKGGNRFWRVSDWVSRLPEKPLKELTLIRNAPSVALLLFEVVS